MNTLNPNLYPGKDALEIKEATPAYFEETLVLVAEFHEIALLPFSTSLTGEALRRLLENPELGFVLLAMKGTFAMGYILVGFGYSLEFAGRDAFVDELYVRPEHQRQGTGAALLQEAERLATKRGINALHLESDFENPGATALYERKSYRKHSRFLMTKWLTPSGDSPITGGS